MQRDTISGAGYNWDAGRAKHVDAIDWLQGDAPALRSCVQRFSTVWRLQTTMYTRSQNPAEIWLGTVLERESKSKSRAANSSLRRHLGILQEGRKDHGSLGSAGTEAE